VERRARARSTRPRDRDRQRERGARAEERRAGDRADGADRDRAVVDLERERLPAADERDDASSRSSRAWPKSAEHAAAMPTTLTSPTRARAAREREEARPVQRVRPGGGARAPGAPRGGRQRRTVVAVLRHGDEARWRFSGISSGSELASRTRLRPWSLAR
jgi:hypothetical protein